MQNAEHAANQRAAASRKPATIGVNLRALSSQNNDCVPPLSLLIIPPVGLYLLAPSAQPDAPSAYLSHQEPYTQ